jgi:hypothetical protein
VVVAVALVIRSIVRAVIVVLRVSRPLVFVVTPVGSRVRPSVALVAARLVRSVSFLPCRVVTARLLAVLPVAPGVRLVHDISAIIGPLGFMKTSLSPFSRIRGK